MTYIFVTHSGSILTADDAAGWRPGGAEGGHHAFTFILPTGEQGFAYTPDQWAANVLAHRAAGNEWAQ